MLQLTKLIAIALTVSNSVPTESETKANAAKMWASFRCAHFAASMTDPSFSYYVELGRGYGGRFFSEFERLQTQSRNDALGLFPREAILAVMATDPWISSEFALGRTFEIAQEYSAAEFDLDQKSLANLTGEEIIKQYRQQAEYLFHNSNCTLLTKD